MSETPAKLLTYDEWVKNINPPFYWITVKIDGKPHVFREVIIHWIKNHCSGWFYYDGINIYVFEKKGDYVMFKIWISNPNIDPLPDEGSIE